MLAFGLTALPSRFLALQWSSPCSPFFFFHDLKSGPLAGDARCRAHRTTVAPREHNVQGLRVPHQGALARGFSAVCSCPPTTRPTSEYGSFTMTAPGQTWSSQPYLDHISAGPDAHASNAFDDARKHTQQPIVTGTSILALRYKDGIMMASDTLASYGSLSRFMDVRRIVSVEGANSLVGAGGDMSDFQYIQHSIDKLM